MKHINWSELTPCATASQHRGRRHRRGRRPAFPQHPHGHGVHAGSYALGPGYTPDYKALKALWDACTEAERQAVNTEFNAWLQRMKEHYQELCQLWSDGDKSLNLRCRMMTALVTPDTDDA
ncbi:MAG: hypothetical protein ACLU9S_16930 [Oscillospiraceae bacterium]